MKSLVLNLGSTSTKVAIYEYEDVKCTQVFRHSTKDLSCFTKLSDQLEFRRELVARFLKEQGYTPRDLDCVISRGGTPPNVRSGATLVNEQLKDALLNHPLDQNPASLGPVIAYGIAQEGDIPAYIYDPVTANELNPLARMFGVKGIEHDSMGHVLNTRAVGISVAEELGKRFDELNLIIVHLGGGNSTMLWEHGKLTDTIPTDFGSFSSERCGNIRSARVLDLCREYGTDMVKSWFNGKGGMVSLLGTNDLREVEQMIADGDKFALRCEQALAYQLCKLISSLLPVVNGKIDGIVMTGGGAYWERLMQDIQKRLDYLNVPFYIRPGENEMKALSEGAVRLMEGKEKAHIYGECSANDIQQEDYYGAS